MANGNLNVSVENIFPLIKKFLYSDHEIFLRELISNATDASIKLRHLVSIGEAKTSVDNLLIEVKADEKNKTLRVIDQGIGMTGKEVVKYINEIAFTGAEDFLEKYKDNSKDVGIIGHFGLGFYSAFMVADKVEIITKSYKDEPAVKWQCDGSPTYTLENTDKKSVGTEIVLHIEKDSTEFLSAARIEELLKKYNKFMPIPIKLGTKKETKKTGEGDDAKEETIEVDNIINNPNPAWTKKPSGLKEDDYKNFYRELYPTQFEDPLFNIHLNIDHPFHLTGILYFPRLNNNIQVQKDRIQLYQNQVFITDNIEGIVPEFLNLLRGVIDSPDIPLNVSRSYLQSDSNVKKISSYITKKVADKLSSLFKTDRKSFEEKWNSIKVIIEYGMLSEDSFLEKAENFALYPSVGGDAYYTYEELEKEIKATQTDKDDKLVILYASNKEEQYASIAEAEKKGYVVLLLDSPIAIHLIQKLETTKSNVSFARVDSDHIDKIINKKEDAEISSKLSDEEKETLKKTLEEIVPKEKFMIQLESLDSGGPPFKITKPEFMRRMQDMQHIGGGLSSMNMMPELHTLIVNTNNNVISEVLSTQDQDKKKQIVSQSLDLAKLSIGILKGEELTKFVQRSYELMNIV